MSLLLLGVSHRSAPVPILERLALAEEDRPSFTRELLASPRVSEAMVVSTCNRVEIYANVDSFHGALTDIAGLLSEHSGMPLSAVSKYLYVRFGDTAVEHLFTVAAGLDSLVVGEQQILGQIRGAYESARVLNAAGRNFHQLAQQALRVGKRIHTETDIDSAESSVVSVALDRGAAILGSRGAQGSAAQDEAGSAPTLAGRHAVIVGAGAMGGLALARLLGAGVAQLTVANRTTDRAERLAATAEESGVPAVVVGLDDLASALNTADIVVTCTGTSDSVVDSVTVASALAGRNPHRELVLCDLGVPRNVDRAVDDLEGVTVLDIESLTQDPATSAAVEEVRAARELVVEEVARFLAGERAAEVAPTVTALRRQATEVVDSEVARLRTRLPDLDDGDFDQMRHTVRRVVDKLLHSPTVRIKELVGTPDGPAYVRVLRELFDLPPATGDFAEDGPRLPRQSSATSAASSEFSRIDAAAELLEAVAVGVSDPAEKEITGPELPVSGGPCSIANRFGESQASRQGGDAADPSVTVPGATSTPLPSTEGRRR